MPIERPVADAAGHAKIREVLSGEHMVRLYQIRLQVCGAVYGLNNKSIANRLKLTDEQKKKADCYASTCLGRTSCADHESRMEMKP